MREQTFQDTMSDKTVATLQDLQKRVQDTITNKVRDEFLSIIPDAMFQELVKKEIDRFISPTMPVEDHRYGTRKEAQPSQLSQMIATELSNLFKDKVKQQCTDWMSGSGFSNNGDSGVPRPPDVFAGAALKAVVAELAPQIMQRQQEQAIFLALKFLRDNPHALSMY